VSETDRDERPNKFVNADEGKLFQSRSESAVPE